MRHGDDAAAVASSFSRELDARRVHPHVVLQQHGETNSHFKRQFSSIGTLALARRSVNRMKSRSSPAVFSPILLFGAPEIP